MSDTVISPSGKILDLVATTHTTQQSDSSIKEIRIKMNPPPSLPILLARYCVVPKDMPHSLPAWAGGRHVKEVDIGPDYHYALRTLRAGFVYLFYDKNPAGSNQWECYTVNADGSVVKQSGAKTAQAPAGKVQGNTLDTHAIEIEHPDKCGTAWIAYSEHKWSKDTLDRYTTDAKLRDARMQTLKVLAMATTGQHTHGSQATKEALEAIVEYAPGFDRDKLPDATDTTLLPGKLSTEDGIFNESALLKQSTRYPWHPRSAQAETTVARMKARAKRPDGGAYIPTVLALWDAIGIVHELNGFRNEAAGRIGQYGQERELQITAVNAIEGVKQALDRKIDDNWDHVALLNSREYDSQEISMRQRAVTRYAKNFPEDMSGPLYMLDNDYKAERITEATYKARRSSIFADKSSDPAAIEAEFAKIDQHRRERARQTAPHLAKRKQSDKDKTWNTYNDRLEPGAKDNFKQKWDGFLDSADKIIDGRTRSLVKWLEAPLFIDTLEDFHPANIEDGVMFEDAVGEALFGIGSTKAGHEKLDAWIKEAKASVKSNLLWRAVALNQVEGIIEVDAALNAASGPSQTLTGSAWESASAHVKWNKLADLYKKAQTLANTNVKAGVKPIDPQRMSAVKDILLTVGDRIFKPFTRAIDTANEKVLQTLLLTRAGAEPKAALALVKVQIEEDTLDREAFLRRLANNSHYLDEARQARLRAAWAALRTGADVPNKDGAFNAAKDARLALVVAILEGINLWKASESAGKTPNDVKTQAQLMAARLATTAAVMDVASNFVKGLATAGDRALSYQALKVGGGALSGVATAYAAKLDKDSFVKSYGADDYRMATFYFVRAWFQATSAVLTALTALSYCSPLIETFGKRFGERLIGKAITAAATRLLLWRAALIFATLEVSIFVLAVSGVIWYFEPDALEAWCDRCAFGAKRNELSDRYTSGDKQLEAYSEALREVL